MKAAARLARQQCGLTFEVANAGIGDRRRRTKEGVGQHNYPAMAQLVEGQVDLRQQRGKGREGAGGALLEQMHRNHNFRKWDPALGQRLADSTYVRAEFIEVLGPQVADSRRQVGAEDFHELTV